MIKINYTVNKRNINNTDKNNDNINLSNDNKTYSGIMI